MNVNHKLNPYIEYARVIGIFILVVYHLGLLIPSKEGLWGLFALAASRGWVATDFFLVLAGYFFLNSYAGKNEVNTLLYIKKRVFRIVPGYFIFVLIYITLGVLLQQMLGNSMHSPDGFWVYLLTFTANISMAYGVWSGVALEGVFALSLVVQLYALFLVLFTLIKGNKNRLILILLVQLVAIYLRHSSAFYGDTWKTYFFTFTRIDGFLWGMALYLLYGLPAVKRVLLKYHYPILWGSIALLVVSLPLTHFLDVHQSFTTAWGFLLMSIFFFGLMNTLLQIKPKVRVFNSGGFVYSIYLVKLPLIYIVLGLIQQSLPELNTNGASLLLVFLGLLLCIVWGLFFSHVGRRFSACTIIERYEK